jgi:uncharacterized membrane protein YidH (DUF202 family)
MPLRQTLGIIFIVAGAAGLIYGSFTYTKDTHQADIGPVSLTVNERERVNVPVWAGIGALVFGVALLLIPRQS